LLDQQHHQLAQRGQLLAHLGITKIEEVKTKELVVGAPKGTAGVIYATSQQACRHEVQDRHWLSGRQRGQHRDGARRGARPRLELLGLLEVHQAAVDRERRRFSSWRRWA
jgi:hypothetical protein